MNSEALFGAVLKAIACTPNRCFDPAAYERDVLQPALEVRKLAERSQGAELSADEVERVLELLKGILQAKQVEPDERAERLQEVVERAGGRSN